MTTDDQVLIPEDQLWSAVGDSLGHRTCPAKNHKRSGSPNLEYIRPQYKRRPYIRQTNIVPATILSSEPRSVAGHVKKREGPKFAALPPPVSKSSVPSGVSQSGGDGTEGEEGGGTGGGIKKVRAMKAAKTTRTTMKAIQGLSSKRGQATTNLKA
jgi:hypothetical protein